MLIAHGLIAVGALRGQAFLEPLQCRCHARILIAQALNELDRKGGWEGVWTRVAPQQRVGLGGVTVDAQQLVGERIRVLARTRPQREVLEGAANEVLAMLGAGA